MENYDPCLVVMLGNTSTWLELCDGSTNAFLDHRRSREMVDTDSVRELWKMGRKRHQTSVTHRCNAG